MGFHLTIARLSGEDAPERNTVVACLDRQEWLSRRPPDPSAPPRVAALAEFLVFDPGADPVDAGVGTLDVIGTVPRDGSYEAPWLAVRLGGGLHPERLTRALQRLLALADELKMLNPNRRINQAARR